MSKIIELPSIVFPDKNLTKKPYLIVLIGPPCSGKSSFCKRLLEQERFTFRVNQDDIRSMVKSSSKLYWKQMLNTTEKIVYKLNSQIVRTFIDNKLDVVVDNTHCNPKVLANLLEEFKSKAEIDIVIFEVPLWKLKLRNIIRYIKTLGQTWIPVKVIENMYDNLEFIKVTLKSQGYEFQTIN